MANYVYDSPAPSLPTPKTNRAAIPAGEDPTKWVSATDWNLVAQAALDLRTAIRTGGKWFAFEQQASAPNGSATDYVYRDTTGNLLLQISDGTDRRVRLARTGTTTTSDGAGQTQDVTIFSMASDRSAVLLKSRVQTIKDDGLDAVGFVLGGVFRRTGGVITQVGSTNIERIPLVAGPPNATYNINGTTLQVRVTGIAAQTWLWRVETEYTLVV